MIASRAAISVGIASAPDGAPSSVPAAETWYVAMSSGTRAMTLDDLDEALAQGDVDFSTRVWIPGMAEWEALGDVANLEDGPPLECLPGKMLEYGLDAERSLQNDDGSARPSVGDIRDYDPFSFPPPATDIPDPNRALWASILPHAAEPAHSVHTGVRLRVDPWWKANARMPWVGLISSGTLVLCLSVLGVMRMLFAEPAEQTLHATTLALQAPPIPALVSEAPAPAGDDVLADPASDAPALVRYEELAGRETDAPLEQKPRVDPATTRASSQASPKAKVTARAATQRRAVRSAARRP